VGLGTGLIKPKTLVAVDTITGALERQLVAGSEILKAARFAIAPNNETPGVTELRLLTVNPATQSTKILVDTTVSPVNVITLTSRGWGIKFNSITVAVDNTAKEVTIKLDNAVEIFTYATGAGTLAALVAAINARSILVSALLLAAGNETLATIAASAMTDATDGTVTNQDWIDVFDILVRNQINLVCVIDASSTVQLQLVEHCALNRRIGFCGYTLQTGWEVAATRATNIGALKTRAAALASSNVLFWGVGTDNEPSYISVAKVAGISAGNDPSVPLNNRDLGTSTVETDFSVEDAEDCLDHGVSVPFRRINVNRPGFVVADGVSSFSGNDNLFDRLITVRRGAYAMEEDIRNEVEQFLGMEATEVTVGRVVSAVNRRLERALRRDVSVRIAGFDSKFTRAIFESTVLRIFYSFQPIMPIRFIVPIGTLKPTIIERTFEIPLGT